MTFYRKKVLHKMWAYQVRFVLLSAFSKDINVKIQLQKYLNFYVNVFRTIVMLLPKYRYVLNLIFDVDNFQSTPFS